MILPVRKGGSKKKKDSQKPYLDDLLELPFYQYLLMMNHDKLGEEQHKAVLGSLLRLVRSRIRQRQRIPLMTFVFISWMFVRLGFKCKKMIMQTMLTHNFKVMVEKYNSWYLFLLIFLREIKSKKVLQSCLGTHLKFQQELFSNDGITKLAHVLYDEKAYKNYFECSGGIESLEMLGLYEIEKD